MDTNNKMQLIIFVWYLKVKKLNNEAITNCNEGFTYE